MQSGDEATRVRAHLGDRIADLERDLAASCRERDALRARLESAEAAAQKALDVWEQTYIAGDHGINLAHAMIALRESLGAAGERSDG